MSGSWPLHTNQIPGNECVCVLHLYFRSADLISASVVSMSTVVLTKVSSAELKLQQKLSEQRAKEESKARENHAKEAQKVMNKLSSTRMGLEGLVNKPEFSTLPEMVRNQLEQLHMKMEAINNTCSSIVAGNGDGALLTVQDTMHT
jgi:hypothetical protein